jgi:membrane protein
MGHKVTPKGIWEVLKNSFKGFGEDKVPKLSASLAYYTVFSLGPLLIVIIFICGIVFGREAIEGTIYHQMEGFVGPESAKQMQEIVKNAAIDKGGFAAIIGIITLLVGATTVFAEMQDSINTIWGLKSKPKLGIWKMIKDRLLSFGIIGSLGFLLLVSLGVTAIIEGLGNRLKDVFPDITVVVIYIINIIVTLLVTTGLFAVIFRVLPDAKIKWKDVLGGAIATSILFMIGKFLITFYISKSEIGSTYGTAGSLIVLILWIYYSSIILYFGAEFTKAYALKYGAAIQPSEFAVALKTVEVEAGNGESIQQVDQKAKDAKQEGKQAADGGRKQHQSGPPQRYQPQRKQKPELQYDYNQKPLGMFDLIGALAIAAITKISDMAEPAKKEG